jgi:hypothetical protein
VATVLAPGVHRRGQVSQRSDVIKTARLAGREAVFELGKGEPDVGLYEG